MKKLFTQKISYKAALIFLATASLGGCAGTGAEYRPIVDPATMNQGMNYEADLSACQQLAEQRDYANGDTGTSALVGAGIGTAIGALTGSWEGAGIGAVAGGGVGAGSGALSTKEERKRIVIRCMQGRGYQVLN